MRYLRLEQRIHRLPKTMASLCLFLGSVAYAAFCIAGAKEDARAKFVEGTTLFVEQKYAEAYASFKDSYALKPVLNVLYNIAMCEMVLGKYVESIHSFEQVVRDGAEVLKPDMLDKAAESIEKLSALLGTLRLKGIRSGTRLEIDGSPVTPPLLDAPVLLNPGQHTIVLSMEGYESIQTVVNLGPGIEVVIPAALTPTADETVPPPRRLSAAPIRPEPTVTIRPGILTPVNNGVKQSVLVYSGLGTTALGLVGIGVGGFMTYRMEKNADDAAASGVDYVHDRDWEAYVSAYSAIERKFNRAELGMKIGYISGGILTTTGLALVLVGLVSKGKERKAQAVQLTMQGAVVEF